MFSFIICIFNVFYNFTSTYWGPGMNQLTPMPIQRTYCEIPGNVGVLNVKDLQIDCMSSEF